MYFQHTLVTGIAPAFYKSSSKKTSKSKIIGSCSRLLEQYGRILNSVILHLITLIIYSTMGAILRHTVFHYNIKKTYGVDEDIMYNYTNNSMRPNGTENPPEKPSYLDQILFEAPLHNFPIHFIGLYIIFIVVFVLLSAIYYCFLHPWKNILSAKRSNKHIQEDKRKHNSQQGDNESSPISDIAEISNAFSFLYKDDVMQLRTERT